MFLSCTDISFAYLPEKQVLKSISFSLTKGETLSIVGSSGCGKSTLLRLISAILPASKGNHMVGELSINNQTPDQYRKSGRLAFMFQEATLMPNLTVRENIEFPLKIKSVSNRKKLDDLLETVGLTEFQQYLPKQLSGGMKTRVALARSFITDPELLLLDEPFSALDIAWKAELYKELNLLREKNKTTIVFVTHDIDEAITLAGKNIIVLSKKGYVMLDVRLNGVLNIKEEVINKIINDHDLTFVERNEK